MSMGRAIEVVVEPPMCLCTKQGCPLPACWKRNPMDLCESMFVTVRTRVAYLSPAVVDADRMSAAIGNAGHLIGTLLADLGYKW